VQLQRSSLYRISSDPNSLDEGVQQQEIEANVPQATRFEDGVALE